MKEEMEARRAEMQAAFDGLVANANATRGAMQEIDYWLKRMAELEAAKPSEDAPA